MLDRRRLSVLAPARRPGASGSLPYQNSLSIPVLKYRYKIHIAYGTIGDMTDHRPRLSDDDMALVLAALRARMAMTTGLRKHRVERLVSRLAEMARGNPKLTLGELEQTHEEELDAEDLED